MPMKTNRQDDMRPVTQRLSPSHLHHVLLHVPDHVPHRGRFCRTAAHWITMLVVCGITPSVAADPVTITYSYSNLFEGGLATAAGFEPYEMLQAVEEGLSLWSQVVPLTFVETIDSGPPVSDSQYLAASHPQTRIGHHDLAGNVLAHAYYPGFGGLSSDLHLDSSNRRWSESLFLTVVTHELGHTIGVDHIDGVRSIMNTSLGGSNMLSGLGQGRLFAPEIEAAQARWGTGSGDVITSRVWTASDSEDWSDHDNWDRGWRPTQHSESWIQTNARVQIQDADETTRSLTMAGGNNALEIGPSGGLRILHDLQMGVRAGGTALIAVGDLARVIVPTNSEWETNWFQPELDDHTWPQGPTGIGFDRSADYGALIETDIQTSMYGRNSSVYTRIEFDVTDPEALDFLHLRMQYDDGFTAYLNGTPIASVNSPESLHWNSLSTGVQSDTAAVEFEEFDISEMLPLLRRGRNVLAIQGLNQRAYSTDLLIRPELYGDALDNTLRLDGGFLNLQGDLRLAQDSGSQSHLQLVAGELQISGQVETGAGHSRLEMRGGTLRLIDTSEDPESAKEQRSLPIQEVDWYDGQLDGVTAIDGQFHHHAGVFSINHQTTPFTISGDYQMQELAVLRLSLTDDDNSQEALLRVDGTATLQGTLAISSHASDDVDSLPVGATHTFPLISAHEVENGFHAVKWNEQPFHNGHQGAGLFGFLDGDDQQVLLTLYRAPAGDASGDGRFNTEDIVQVFQMGEYEDAIDDNSDWTEGDWDGDRDFTTHDMIAAFETGQYETTGDAAMAHPVPEPNGLLLLLVGILAAWVARRPLTDGLLGYRD